jgi:DNA-binding transcriptional MocR family regulator
MERTLNAASLATLLGRWSGRGPAYQNLARALRQSILDGRVPLAARLPGERELAAALGVSRTTVTAAYAVLRDEGFVVTRHGARGTTALPLGVATQNLPLPTDPAPGGLLDLAYATLSAPEGVVHRAYAAALNALPAYLPTHGYAPLGLPVLREVIAERYTGRGLPTNAEQIIVTFGAQHAFSLLVRVLTGPGDRVLVDQPTYPHALDALRQATCRVVPVALTDEGWDVEALRATIRQTTPRLAYLIPDFHNPTGWCMTEPQRAAVAHAAFESRTTVVVDETLVDLALDVPVSQPFAVHARHSEVVTIGSMSKSFWGGLRIGWIRAPRALVARIAAGRAAVDLGTPILEQLAAAHLLANAEPTLEMRRGTLRRQRATLMEQLKNHLPEWRYGVPEGGLSLWVTLPVPVSSALAATAERFGVRVAAGSRFAAEGLLERHLRVPFTLPKTDLTEAMVRLAQAYLALTGWTGDSTALARAETTVV